MFWYNVYMQRSNPVYIQIRDYIINNINSGKLKSGSKIETETELMSKFNVSRMTANKAVSLLSNEGIVERIPGRGTFVKSKMNRASYVNLVVDSMTDYILSLNKKPGAILLDFTIFKAKQNQEIKDILSLSDDDYVYYFARVRTADNEPVVYATSYVSAKHVPPLSEEVLKGSFYKYLKENGINKSGYKSTVEAISANSKIAKLLNIKKGDPVLYNEGLLYIKDRIPTEYSEIYFIGNMFSYQYEEYFDWLICRFYYKLDRYHPDRRYFFISSNNNYIQIIIYKYKYNKCIYIML